MRIGTLKEILKDDPELMDLIHHSDITTTVIEPEFDENDLPPVVKKEYNSDEAVKKMNAFFE